VYVANIGNGPSVDNAVSVLDAGSDTVVTRVPVVWPWRLAINPAGSRVYAAEPQDVIRVIDTAANAVVATLPVEGNVLAIAAGPSSAAAPRLP
jgi:YVTN family beta-propeller protein